MGFDPGSPGSRPGPKAGAKPLRHPGIPQSFSFKWAGNISFMGTTDLISVGDTILLNDFGNFSGKYMIDDLKIDFLSYKINAEIHKVIDFEVEND